MKPDDFKSAAAEAALILLPESGVIGLGSGSTAELFISGLARLVEQGRNLQGVPTSQRSRALAAELGIPLLSDDGPWQIDVCVDGADEVSDQLDLIKGGGGCHSREKIVNASAAFNIIIVDASKLSRHLGQIWPVPVEVLSFGVGATEKKLAALGDTRLRLKDGAPWMTDAGNFIFDVTVGVMEQPQTTEADLKRIPGVVETGLFIGRADLVLVANPDGVLELRRQP